MYLPSKYATFFLAASGYSTSQVWQVLYPMLEQNQDVPHCQALINWLRITSHGTAATNAQDQPVIGPPATANYLIAPAADKDLILHRQEILKHALPGLGQPTPGLETALFQMANAMVTQTTDQRLARETRAAEVAIPMLPSTKFRNTLPILLDFLLVAD
jgi:hypothetical protein